MNDPASSPLIRSDIWFKDGTVVLQAERTLFRVYRGVLASQSSIFHDTFGMPQPAEEPLYEGCPILVLQDSPDDVRSFLLAIHDAGYFINSPVNGIQTLSGLLRLATKYDVGHLRDRMISILASIYPTSLPEWVLRQCPAGYEEHDGDDFIALNLALEVDVYVILPSIYYACCRHPFAALLDAPLSITDKKKCVAAVEAFERTWRGKVYGMLLDVISTCDDEGGCHEMQVRWIRDHGLPTFADVFEFDWDAVALCAECTEAGKDEYARERLALWNALPTLFGYEARAQ
ncbi:hypothetical protein C8R43DRAFT_878512 [Mycena crocata]|nr:hypothetical protein C8R43DRAFT_878512 [Mycena crocata]